ncbi:hypothetical protein [Bacillus proteolyticus]|uniref:hypothetical protein n=1 Tax=Bacillus proteolyticus TaxID=2026192 RepID=UPI001FC9ED90|nr:hypothetical protein [Bacillus proteolyticus]
MQQRGNSNTLRLNPDYYRMILEQLAYLEGLIQRKIMNLEQTFLVVSVELTNEIKTFEIRE